MPLLPDPDSLLAIADRIAGHAGATRVRADALASAVAADDWHGAAAEAFHASADGVLSGLRSSANRLEDAADALRGHARQVAETLAALQRVGHDLGEIVHDARAVAGDTGALLGGALEVFEW